MTVDNANFKLLPSVDRILQAEVLQALIANTGQEAVKLSARGKLVLLRDGIASGDAAVLKRINSAQFFDELCDEIVDSVSSDFSSSLRPVFNLTGTVVHTNLGRARLPDSAIAAMNVVAAEASNLEFDLASGKRGDRDSHLEKSLCELTGAEAATVVNNNAAAVLLVLNSLASNQEVVISRGELVEIGGAFRIPDVMKSANCILTEIGTTNRTHLKDYEAAINKNTAMLMKVHTSNYEIRGFTNTVAEEQLGNLAKKHDLPFVSDLGSGTLVDLKQFNLPDEPTVKQTIEAGADLVTFSGDKLLGGPQAGIIVGRKDLVERIKQNPLKRALRVGKLTLAALLAVIDIYKDPHRLATRLPLLADLTRELPEIEQLAERVHKELDRCVGDRAAVEITACKSQIGSGALPLELLESRAIALTPTAEKGERDAALNQLAAAFRNLPKPVIGRIHDGVLLFDLRCLRDERGFLEQLAELKI